MINKATNKRNKYFKSKRQNNIIPNACSIRSKRNPNSPYLKEYNIRIKRRERNPQQYDYKTNSHNSSFQV